MRPIPCIVERPQPVRLDVPVEIGSPSAQEDPEYAESFQSEDVAGAEDRAQRVLWLKSVYYRLPRYLRPFLYFIYRYFLRFGFLDGKTGFVFHFLQAFWFRLVVDVRFEKLMKRER